MGLPDVWAPIGLVVLNTIFNCVLGPPPLGGPGGGSGVPFFLGDVVIGPIPAQIRGLYLFQFVFWP